MNEIPLRQLHPEWVYREKTFERIGLIFECPICRRISHKIKIGWSDMETFLPTPLYRKAGEDIKELTIAPRIRPAGCGFQGWIKNGKVGWP